ncbi:MAG: exodeoxyribonuclease V subunit beta [Deltaproteobacteria bacterium]|nr:exodeoxyribonuclease V subunit beta [Deltaproteobacteria bacterium]
MNAFDARRVALEGSNLIEAAAGTGKTYSIEGLFVRLIIEQHVPVEQILTVTFTQAATAELRQRIYQRLLNAGRLLDAGAWQGGPGEPQPEQAAVRIRRALMDFDQAAIYTIHGFCQRILHEYAFETGSPFDAELVPDQSRILREIAQDFWRLHVCPAPVEFIAYAWEDLKGPSRFMELLAKIKSPDVRITPALTPGGFDHIERYRHAFGRLQIDWPQARAEAVEILKAAALDGRTYGSLESAGPDGRRTRRDLTVTALAEAMDAFLSSPVPAFPPFKRFACFSSEFLADKTRPRQTVPRHAVFDLCQRVLVEAVALEGEMRRHLSHLKVRLIEFARSERDRRNLERNVQSFDDLLLRVARASAATPAAGGLIDSIRRKYRAVLIDEFQDTDELQVTIFSRMFSDGQRPLFLIGDPKQAIYGFRGADIFSYLKAARNVASTYTLTENRRAVPGLVTALNTIFSQTEHPFLFPEISFRPATAVAAVGGRRTPFVIWYLDSRQVREDGKPVNSGDCQVLISNAVAGEIQRLTQARRDPLPAGDIAVLVRTNGQAHVVKQRLSAAGIPAVVCSTGNIFDAREAEDMQRVLTSLADPSDIGRLKAALATDLLGAHADDIAGADREPNGWEERLSRTRDYFQVWHRQGFMPMFRRLLAGEHVKERLLSFPDGERRLTNLLHIGELLHHAAGENNLGMTGLLKWLAEQRDPSTPRLEEHQLRLESDEAAVKIVTIHKSKGLEYRVVFCPFAWSGSSARGPEVFFHDPAAGRRLTLDLGGEDSAHSHQYAEAETLSENLRLLYVALTRAKERCYLVWGRIHTSETSSLAYLFHFRDAGDCADPDIVERMKQALKAKSDEDLLQDLKTLVTQSQATIDVRPLPDVLPKRARPPADDSATLCSRQFAGKIDRSWRIVSYSALASAAGADGDAADRDGLRPFQTANAGPGGPGPGAAAGLDLFAFPKGSRAGNFFHAVLEHADFGTWQSAETDALVGRMLAQFGYAAEWRAAVLRMIGEVAGLCLFAGAPGLTLAGIGASERLSEMEFYYPLHPVSPARLEEIFRRHERKGGSGFADRIGRLTFAPMQGFMRGFIDMVFRHEERYYLVDWKSNHLGDTYESYHASRLVAPMQEDFYTLQYHIYTLALHQYLRRRLPAYRYERHFGGVAYVFLRGVDRRRGSEFGVFVDTPHPDLVNALGSALIPSYE